jgi:t-SNARE complex subunit (syntaxin)
MVKKDIEILEDMVTSLVDLMVEKGVITQTEFEDKVKQKLENNQEG